MNSWSKDWGEDGFFRIMHNVVGFDSAIGAQHPNPSPAQQLPGTHPAPPSAEEQLRREEKLAIEAEQRRIRHHVCLGTHACPSTSVLASTELRAFIYDLEGAAHAELKPTERHDTEQGHADEPSGAPSHRLSDDTL